MRKRLYLLFALVVVLGLVVLPLAFLYKMLSAPPALSYDFTRVHILGGFSINTPAQATSAAENGIQVAFEYGQPPSTKSPLGQKLQSLHMKVIDGYIASYLYHYECHRTYELHPQLLGVGQYCRSDDYPFLTNTDVLLATIASHLRQVENNPLIMGYWVLDDWVQWDAGSAKTILPKIYQLIQQYTPGYPAICGFGGNIGLHQRYSWKDWIADNFSPQGCDMVGFYIYTFTLPDTLTPSSPDAYNWSMEGVLPAMFASLKKRGWRIDKEPLLGIGQAFGGPKAQVNDYWITPTAQDIEMQSLSFCEHGATGLAFFAWDSSTFDPDTRTPLNSSQITRGIGQGIASCKQYWKQQVSN